MFVVTERKDMMTTELSSIDRTTLMPDVWGVLKEQAGMLVKSGFMPPAVKTPEAALAIMLQGREVGMGPMASIRHINVIQGKPTMSAEGMLALVYRALPGFKAEPVEDTDDAFAIRLTRPGQQPYVSRFTMEDGKKAGLTGKDSWLKYSRAMLRARAISAGLRLIAPDALMGVSYTPEEMGAVVNEGGEIIEAEVLTEAAPQSLVEAVHAKAEAAKGEETEAHRQLREAYRAAASSVLGNNAPTIGALVRETLVIPRGTPTPTDLQMTNEQLKKMVTAITNIADKQAETAESDVAEEAAAA